MDPEEQTQPGVQVRQAPDGSFMVDLPGGGEIRFHVSGLGSTVGLKVEVVTAKPRGLFDEDDDGPWVARPTGKMPALVPDDPSRKPIGVAGHRPRAGSPLPKRAEKPAGPLLWIRSQKPPEPEHRDARPWLVEAEGIRIGLLPGYTYSIGRDEHADIRIIEAAKKGDTVSRMHATLAVTAGGLHLIDADSRNGTYTGSRRVQPSSPLLLRERTDLFFGKFALVVRPAPNDLKVP